MLIDELTQPQYCESLTEYRRLPTRVVDIGGVPLGGQHPIRVQSMTTTDTMDTAATVDQSIRIIEAGADYVRITAPSQNEARNLEPIKNELRKRGYTTPLVADIHFTPNAAEIAARIVEKVRVNPGNYADRKKFDVREYTDSEYEAELYRIRERFSPLVEICKTHGTAMRIGTNHGSLSDRIMNRYGDTPLGMVESALEFTRICRDLDYHHIVFSMKASNPQVMIQAYRLLVNRMQNEQMDYPLHLGVTEAGDGEDGRIKSAVGIGTLLEDGLGDTIRVSLTEEPEAEVPVCIRLLDRYTHREDHAPIQPLDTSPVDPFVHSRRASRLVDRVGGDAVPVVVAAFDAGGGPRALSPLGYDYDPGLDKWNIGDMAVDYVFLGDDDIDFGLPGTLGRILNAPTWSRLTDRTNAYPMQSLETFLRDGPAVDVVHFIEADAAAIDHSTVKSLSQDPEAVLVLVTHNTHAMPQLRRAFAALTQAEAEIPVIVRRIYASGDEDQLMLDAATDIGGLLTDGLGDGIWIESPSASSDLINRTAFGVLQATRTRISKTEYISCPSCGRTLFGLVETTAMIRERTSHLKGVKIGIMGCIVNGPGEMADADYGYVGSGPGQITLYRGQEIVKRGIPTDDALEELIELIRSDGNWQAEPVDQ